MSAWKLVEAVAEESNTDNHDSPTPAQANQLGTTNRSSSSSAYAGRGTGGRGRGRSNDGTGRGRGRHSSTSPNSSPSHHNSSSSPRYPGPYRSHQDRSYFSYLATQQIDQIFNPDSLCIDTFIRSYMDEAGYVPLSLLCSYQNVAQFQCTYNDILKKLKEVVIKCKYIELDTENETVRLKTGWEKFLMPNAFGGRGLPRYVKQPHNHSASSSSPNNASTNSPAGTTPATDSVAATNPQELYAYWAAQSLGYYPEFAYDPYAQYYDPNAAAYTAEGDDGTAAVEGGNTTADTTTKVETTTAAEETNARA